jgi:hypothetical protein
MDYCQKGDKLEDGLVWYHEELWMSKVPVVVVSSYVWLVLFVAG